MKLNYRYFQSGTTLIELITAIVIISIVVVGLLSLVSSLTSTSADPMITQQANAIAQSYLDEITSKEFCDPDWDADSDPATVTQCRIDCTSSVCSACRGTGLFWTGEEADRANYDDICDYDGLNESPTIQDNSLSGQSFQALNGYQVSVEVIDDNSTSLTGGLGSITSNSGEMAVIRVTVSHPELFTSNRQIQMTAVRANY